MNEPEGPWVIVLHRLVLDAHRLQQAQSIGLPIVTSSSVAQTLAAAAAATRVCVLVDLGVGGHGPEKIARALRDHPKAELMACTTQRHAQLTSRARQLGVDRVFIFPEGALSRVFELSPDVPRLEMRRTAERAQIGEQLQGDLLHGTLVNISATGALIEIDPSQADVDEVRFAFGIPGAVAEPVTLRGRVCWRGADAKKTRVGVSFIGVDDVTREALSRFVQGQNVLRVVAPGAPPPSPSPATRLEKVRVQRIGDSRVDFFALQMEPGDDDALLVPRVPFIVWWNTGDLLSVRRGTTTTTFQVVERVPLEPQRVDGRVGWRIRPDAADASGTDGRTTPTPTPTDRPG